MKTFEQFKSDIDPYGEEEWVEEEFSIGEHKIVLTQDYTFDFYKSRRDIDEEGHEVWLEDELFKLNSKAGDELIVDVVDIDQDGLFDDRGDQIITISYDDETGYRGVALVPLKIIKIKE